MRLRRDDPEQFHCLVKMHLSFLLDMNTDDCDCSFLFAEAATSSSSSHRSEKHRRFFVGGGGGAGLGIGGGTPSKKGIMEGAPLTMEGVCQVFQLAEYLGRHMDVEGLFRKHGNLKKQQVLKERLNRGVRMNLDDGEFSVHECASVLKNFLAELPEPLLTDAYYKAHCQVALAVMRAAKSECAGSTNKKTLQALQLLLLLVPDANYRLLKDVLLLLHQISLREDRNKMSAANLGTIFATHLVCPRKLSAETIQCNHQMYAAGVAFMIQEAPKIFESLPNQLVEDVRAFRDRQKRVAAASSAALSSALSSTSARKNPRRKISATFASSTAATTSSSSSASGFHSPVVNTIFSFVDRARTSQLASEDTTETALAELYAQVQAMPESAQKRRLVNKLNEANGCGTPRLRTDGGGCGGIRGWITNTPIARSGSKAKKKAAAAVSEQKKMIVGRAAGSYSIRQDPSGDPQGLVGERDSFRRRSDQHLQTRKILDEEAATSTMLPPPPATDVRPGPATRRRPPLPPPRVSSLKPKCASPLEASKMAQMGSDEAEEEVMETKSVAEVATSSSLSTSKQPRVLHPDRQAVVVSSDAAKKLDFDGVQDDDDNDVEGAGVAGSADGSGTKDKPSSTSTLAIRDQGEKILRGEVELSDSLQLCLDGEELSSSLSDEENLENSGHHSSGHSSSPASTNSPGGVGAGGLTTDENDDSDNRKRSLRNSRKRSLTEVNMKNPLDRGRVPLGERRCFETDL